MQTREADVDLIPKPRKKDENAKASLFAPKALFERYDEMVETFNKELGPDDERWSRNSLMVYALTRYAAEVDEQGAKKRK